MGEPVNVEKIMSEMGITNSDPLIASSKSLVRPSNTSRQ